MTSLPRAQDLLDLGGVPSDPRMDAMAEKALKIVTALARGYTRGVGFGRTGFDAEEDLALVVLAASARLFSNPLSVRRVEAGSYNSTPSLFEGWTLAELGVLNNYRVRASALPVREELEALQQPVTTP